MKAAVSQLNAKRAKGRRREKPRIFAAFAFSRLTVAPDQDPVEASG